MSNASSDAPAARTVVASDADVHDALRLDPGEQALLSTSKRKPRLDALPAEAFGNLLVVSTGLHPAEVEAVVERRGRDPSAVGVVPVTATEVHYDGPLWVGPRVAPSDLTGISVGLTRGFSYLEPGAGWLAFDSISTLLMYAEERRLFRLLDWLVGSARSEDVRGVYAVVRSMVEASSFRRFGGLFDAVVEEE